MTTIQHLEGKDWGEPLPLLRTFDAADEEVRAAIEACEQRNSMAPPEPAVE